MLLFEMSSKLTVQQQLAEMITVTPENQENVALHKNTAAEYQTVHWAEEQRTWLI